MKQSRYKLNAGFVWRLGIVLVFLLVYSSTGGSGPLLFDNNIIGRATIEQDWARTTQISNTYEWLLLFASTAGLCYFLFHCCGKLPTKVTIQQLFRLVIVAAIASCLFSLEFRDYIRQRAAADDLEQQGWHVCFIYHSRVFAGAWYTRIVLTAGLFCSVWGGVFAILRCIVEKPSAGRAR